MAIPSKNKILSNLTPYEGKKIMVKKNQSVEDIISGILQQHKKYRGEYDKIYNYFEGIDLLDSCENIYDFLEKNTEYKIESEEYQLLKSPAAILSQNNNDCKNFALFTGGILSAMARNGNEPIDYCYRFASYRNGSDDPEHVFIVVNPGTKNEIWIDNVLPTFNLKKKPVFYYDYKPESMAMYKVAGIESFAADASPVGLGLDVLTQVSKLFAAGGAPNPNDWQGWTPGDVKQWVKNDGDSIKNEAVNIISYLKAHGLTDITDSDSFGRYRVTIHDIANKLSRAGFPQEAQVIAAGGSIQSSGAGTMFPQTGTTKTFTSYLPWIVGGALAIYFLTGKKK